MFYYITIQNKFLPPFFKTVSQERGD